MKGNNKRKHSSSYRKRIIPAFGKGLSEREKKKLFLYGSLLFGTIGIFLFVLLSYFLFSQSPSLIGGKCIAEIDINGEITTQSISPSLFQSGVVGSEEIAGKIRELEDRDDVAALLVVVNSPGGSVVATREIYHALENFSKPKVFYLREIAASGGYYLSTSGDYIYADPNVLTGSIGAIMTFTEMKGLLSKLGVNFTSVTSGKHKDIGAFYKGLDEEERRIVQGIINETFEEFKSIVIKGRGNKLNKKEFKKILDGRILSGRQAYRIGLVDGLGTKEDAVRKAAELAGLDTENPKVCKISMVPGQSSGSLFGKSPIFRGFFSQLINSLFGTDRREYESSLSFR